MRISQVLGFGFLLATVAGCNDFYDDNPAAQRLLIHHLVPMNVAEPTVDLVDVAVGRSETRIGVGVKTAGGPAPDTAYSNYVEVRIENGSESIDVIQQRHDGVDSTILDGVAAEDVDYIPTPWGHYIEVPRNDGWDPDASIFEIFMGFLESEGGTLIEDESGELPSEETEPLEDILSEIDEVFVPS